MIAVSHRIDSNADDNVWEAPLWKLVFGYVGEWGGVGWGGVGWGGVGWGGVVTLTGNLSCSYSSAISMLWLSVFLIFMMRTMAASTWYWRSWKTRSVVLVFSSCCKHTSHSLQHALPRFTRIPITVSQTHITTCVTLHYMFVVLFQHKHIWYYKLHYNMLCVLILLCHTLHLLQ